MRSGLTKLSETIGHEYEGHSRLSNTIVAIGRICFSLIFISAGLNHFTAKSIEHAAAQGVPLASIAVPLSGILALAGGLSILLGYRAKLGAWLIVLFLVPVTFTVHKFWGIADPAVAEVQLIMFMKNVSIIGGALLISHFGAGPLSIDARSAARGREISPIAKVTISYTAEIRNGHDTSLRDSEPKSTQSTGSLN